MKDCIKIGQKATIRDALPEEYKDKLKQEGIKAKYGSGQPTEFAPFDENSNISPDLTRAKSGSFGPVEDVSEDLL